jgi:peptidoglycan hydrolase CwlO-like protein
MLNPSQKKAALESELQQIAKNYQEAQQVMQNCEKKIYELRGCIAACDYLIKTQEEDTKE